jgi:Leucine rich repeat/TIR domain/Leucine rich repeat C-terminal domain
MTETFKFQLHHKSFELRTKSRDHKFVSLILLVIMSTGLLADFAVTSQCPIGCTCQLINQLDLTIDCRHMGPVKDGGAKLFALIDAMLSPSTESSPFNQVTTLRIINSPLAEVPSSICHLRALRSLQLDHNNLIRLPEDCFVHMTQLVNLTAVHNAITALQDGLFDGLSNLELIDLSYNIISWIGQRVFINESDLPSLHTIDLSYNSLAVIDAWPFVRGRVAGTPDRSVYVGLFRNFIAQSTNIAGVPMGCGSKSPFMILDLRETSIPRLTDLLGGFGIANITEWFCTMGKRGTRSRRAKFYLQLTNSGEMICDCIDFDYYRLTRAFPRYSVLGQTFCAKPHYLEGIEVASVPLDQFVCDVTERCPTGCRCVYRPANATMHIYCSSTNQTTLPSELPPLPKDYVKYKIELQNCQHLFVIEDRSYFINTSILDASESGLEKIDGKAWRRLVTGGVTRKLLLHGNHIKFLPYDAVMSTNISLLMAVSLHDNPWSCSCNDRWIASWFKSVQQQLLNTDGILCNTPDRLNGRNVLRIPEEEFCTDPAKIFSMKLIAVSVSITAVIVFAALLVAYRLRFLMFVRWKLHPFDRDECIGEDMEYDVFFCCSGDDHVSHGKAIVEQLELRGYRVCYHMRDFPPGHLITQSIYHAIVHSKRTVCLLSRSFVNR